MQYPELLKGVRILRLGYGANARNFSLLTRHDEFGEIPQRIASTCREIYSDDVLPMILAMAPWLGGQARAITETPLI